MSANRKILAIILALCFGTRGSSSKSESKYVNIRHFEFVHPDIIATVWDQIGDWPEFRPTQQKPHIF